MAQITEAAHHEEEQNCTGIDNRKLLFWVFLSTDCLFFGALISTYMVYRGQRLVGPYPIDILAVSYTHLTLPPLYSV